VDHKTFEELRMGMVVAMGLLVELLALMFHVNPPTSIVVLA
jgi:hypothetical protein